MYKRSQIENSTPLVRWLLSYAIENEITLTELSRKANLSAGSLRSLVKYPERIPALETCIKLAISTGKPAEDILQMAGLDGYADFQHEMNARLFAALTEAGVEIPLPKQEIHVKSWVPMPPGPGK